MRRASYGSHSPVVGDRGARTRQAIIDAARQSFESKGLHATTVEDIAEGAGISRATLYQYFASKEELFTELIRAAAADLLRVIRRLGPLGPTAAGYDNLHWWLGEWAWAQDKYKLLYDESSALNSPDASLRALIVESIAAYVSSLVPRLAAALGDTDLDVEGVATVLLALLFRVNDYRQKGITRTLPDDEVLDAWATFVQMALFPSTPPDALTAQRAHGTVAGRARASRPGSRRPRPDAAARCVDSAPVTPTVQRILDAAAATFAARGFHATSVQDVLDAAGAGRGTFYKYFPDKTQLLVTLAERCMTHLAQLASRFVETVDAHDDGRALRGWLEECLTLHRRYRGVFRALVQEEARLPELEALRRTAGAAILLSFDDALTRAERPYPFDVRVGSLVLLALLERGPDYAFGTAYDLSDERVVEVLATLIERGLLGRRVRYPKRRPALR